MVERLQEYRADMPLHARQCLKVIDKERRLVPMVLNKPQMILHAKLETQLREHGLVRALILKGRKQGASTYIGARFYSKARLWKYRNAKVMAHDQTGTDVLFKMVQNFYDHDPLRLRADTSNAKEFVFSNGSSYTVATAGGSGEAGRGDTPSLAHLSEVAFYRNPEKNFAGFVNSVPLAKGSEVIAESTANGVGNEFHRRWMRAEANMEAEGDRITFLPIFIPWFISDEYRIPVPSGFALSGEPEGDGLPSEVDIAEMYGLDLAQMAWRRFMKDEQLGGSIETFMQEYPCNPSEAFQTTGVDLFIKPVWVARARRRRDIEAYGPKILGVDPAGHGGDRFCMTLRQGMVMHWHRARKGVDPQDAIHWVAGVIREVMPDRVNIDNGGGWGASLLSGLRAHYPDLAGICYAVDFGGTSQFKAVNPHKPGPRNRRAEMYMRMRGWFMAPEGCSIPDEDILQEDLSVITERRGVSQSTDVLIEAKSAIKKLLGRSPDVSDSAALTFASPDSSIEAALTPEVRSDTAGFAAGGPAPVLEPVAPVRDTWSTGTFGGFDSGGGWM